MPARVLQLTDLHLFAEPGERLKGIPTRESFCDVLDYAEEHYGDYDLLVITGDLAHDEQRETYRQLRQLLGERVGRCCLIPGNHDDRAFLREIFPDRVPPGTGPITFSTDLAGWRLLGLDSHVPGEVAGRIDAEQLHWLRDELQQRPHEPTLLFIHHPPLPVNVPWLDRLGLQDPEAFCRLIESSPQVKAISAGHVHLEFEGRLKQAAFYTTPSTGLQFVPAGDESKPDAVPPGYRLFTLDGDSLTSELVRLPELKYVPHE